MHWICGLLSDPYSGAEEGNESRTTREAKIEDAQSRKKAPYKGFTLSQYIVTAVLLFMSYPNG